MLATMILSRNNEGVQGDLGWSSFEAREASAKALYERRVHRLRDGNWAHRTLRYMIYQERGTKLMHRLRRLRDRYGFEPIWLESAGENRTDETTEHLVLQCRHIVPVPAREGPSAEDVPPRPASDVFGGCGAKATAPVQGAGIPTVPAAYVSDSPETNCGADLRRVTNRSPPYLGDRRGPKPTRKEAPQHPCVST
ncbi:hypothetical protein HPB47_026473 [Ixodes persulcatus]|uniref:Uncharacterized protein n=1 Tax=Ixodes persulcatus TaxID=34615 RepID=A0AC60PZ82_IXOPE|nr:hypothetical protein HPB47_026473 [Ixodes persulcatus]